VEGVVVDEAIDDNVTERAKAYFCFTLHVSPATSQWRRGVVAVGRILGVVVRLGTLALRSPQEI
jgi:hypothetical protein